MTEETKTEKVRLRKTGITRGVRTQKLTTFRLDADLVEYLGTKENKGRFINDCIRGRMKFETTLD